MIVVLQPIRDVPALRKGSIAGGLLIPRFGPRDADCSIFDLGRFTAQYGLKTEIVRGGPESLNSMPLPAIVHFNSGKDTGHYLVLTGIDGQLYWLMDGTSGELLAYERGEVLRYWTGYRWSQHVHSTRWFINLR